MVMTPEISGPPGVLLVEDQPDNRHIMKNMLIGQGYRVSVAGPGDDFRAVLKDSTPAVIVLSTNAGTDMIADICRRLKTGEETDEIPIVIVSEREDLLACSSGLAGPFDYVGRPDSRDEVVARVRNMVKLAELSRQLAVTHKQLVEAQKMECVGALAAGVAHEFNNLMCSVMGFAEMARSGGGNDIEALRESAEVSYEAAKRAATTASSLLAFSRRAKSESAMGNVNEAVSAAVRLLKRNIEKSGVKLEFEPGDLPETKFSFGPMQQVFLNLIINAWHATVEREGRREIMLSSSCSDGSMIRVAVADTGTGISEANLKNIFEPFFTTKSAGDSAGVEGSGLGLMIVKEVVRDHQGVVEVESVEGQGTRFTIVLPVQEADPSEEAIIAATESPVSARSYSVLIVDDEAPTRKIIARMLARRGHRAFQAANMSEAISLLWSQRIDLITMDLVMPESSGITNVLRLREEGIEIPILICTGHADERSVDKALAAGGNGVIRKPFGVADFFEKMDACLRGQGTGQSGPASGGGESGVVGEEAADGIR